MKTVTYRIILLLAFGLLATGSMADEVTAALWRQLQHANLCRQQGKADSALIQAKALLPQVMSHNDHELQAMNYALMATAYSDMGDKQSAMESYARVATIAETNHFIELARQPKHSYLYETMIATYGALALVCDGLGYQEQSLAYTRKGMEWLGQCGNPKDYYIVTTIFTEMMLKYGDFPVTSQSADSADTAAAAPPVDALEQPVMAEAAETDTLTGTSTADTTRQHTSKQKELTSLHIEDVPTSHERVSLIGILLVVVIIVLTCYVLWQKRIHRKKEYEAEEQMEKSYLEGQEQERSRLAKELHDGVSNQLLAIEMRLRDEGELSPKTIKMISESREQVRRVSHGLLPPEFEHTTLDSVLRSYADEMDGVNSCSVSFSSSPADTDWHIIPSTEALEVYRIVQEAVGNAMKHGGATVLSIGLHLEKDSSITVIVSDNGTPADNSPNGIGLRSMQQRAVALGSTLEYSHYPFGGVTRICFRPSGIAK